MNPEFRWVLESLLHPFDAASYQACCLVSKRFLELSRSVCRRITITKITPFMVVPKNLLAIDLHTDTNVPNFPPSLTSLSLEKGCDFPTSLHTLTFTGDFCPDVSLTLLPADLVVLRVLGRNMWSCCDTDFSIFSSLQELVLPAIGSLQKIILPSSLLSLEMHRPMIKEALLPPALERLVYRSGHFLQEFHTASLPRTLKVLQIRKYINRDSQLNYYLRDLPSSLEEYVDNHHLPLCAYPLPATLLRLSVLTKLTFVSLSCLRNLRSLSCFLDESNLPDLKQFITSSSFLTELSLNCKDFSSSNLSVFFPESLRKLTLVHSDDNLLLRQLKLEELILRHFRGSYQPGDLPRTLISFFCSRTKERRETFSGTKFPVNLRHLHISDKLVDISEGLLPYLQSLTLRTDEKVDAKQLPRGLRRLDLSAPKVINWSFFPRHLQVLRLARVEEVSCQHLSPGLKIFHVSNEVKVDDLNFDHLPLLKDFNPDMELTNDNFPTGGTIIIRRSLPEIREDNLSWRYQRLQRFLQRLDDCCRSSFLTVEREAFVQFGIDIAFPDILEREYLRFSKMKKD